MVEQQHYISSGLSHQGDLSGPHGLPGISRASNTQPNNSVYSDVAPFSTVSSFNLPAHCEPSLLTPISSAGSPPLHHSRKLIPQYPPPPATPYSQVPTPPASSKMYSWNGQFDINNQTSQANSPMTSQQPPVVQDNFYIDGRRTPGPPEPYLGSYGVSDGPEPAPIPHHGQPYYVDMQVNGANSLGVVREPVHSHMANAQHPSVYQGHRPSNLEHPGQGIRAGGPQRSSNSPPRRLPVSRSTQSRIGPKRVTKSGGRKSTARGGMTLDPADEHKNCYGEEEPPRLKSTCPDEERVIFESRWRHRHKRGQDMWDSIQQDFAQQFKKNHGKEMLQMKFKRGRSKFLDWLAKDDELVIEAWKRYEKERYQSILNIFLELGGSRNMLLSASDIEVKIVNDLKLEESVYMEAMGDVELRRRRRSTMKKRSGGRGEPGGDVPVSDEMLIIDHHHAHNEDDVINQVYSRRDGRWNEETNGNEMVDVHMWDSRAPMKMEPGVVVPPQEHTMARRACEQLVKVHGNPNGNAHPMSHPPGGAVAQAIYQSRRGS